MIVLVLILLCLLSISIVMNIRAYNNSTKLFSVIDEYEEYFIKLQNQLVVILNHIKTVDERGAFESDDEVGSIFFEIRESVKILDNFLITDGKTEDTTNAN